MRVLWVMSTSVVLLAWVLTSFVYVEDVPRVSYDASVYFNHKHLHTPSTKQQIIEVVKSANANGRKIRVLGSGHSWSDVATSSDLLISLHKFTGLVGVDTVTKEVTVRAGTTLNEFNALLDQRGLAMTNLGSVYEQTVAGVISTGTHGSGLKFGNLATLVNKIEVITGKGEVVTASKKDNPELLKSLAVCVGMCGIITEVTFQCEDSFNLHEILTPMPLSYCMENLVELAGSSEHAKLWMVKEGETCAVYSTNRTDELPRNNSHIMMTIKVMLMEVVLWGLSWFESITREGMGILLSVAEPFEARDRVDVSHRVFKIPERIPVHHEGEVVVGVQDCAAALSELWRVVEKFNIPVNHITEVRFVQADDNWLSPDYQRDSCHITICIYNARKAVRELYSDEFYKACRKFDARVHWGKYFNLNHSDTNRLYPKLSDFRRVLFELDPDGVFRNKFVQETFGF